MAALKSGTASSTPVHNHSRAVSTVQATSSATAAACREDDDTDEEEAETLPLLAKRVMAGRQSIIPNAAKVTLKLTLHSSCECAVSSDQWPCAASYHHLLPAVPPKCHKWLKSTSVPLAQIQDASLLCCNRGGVRHRTGFICRAMHPGQALSHRYRRSMGMKQLRKQDWRPALRK